MPEDCARLKLPESLNRVLRRPRLTRVRIILAFSLAVAADGLQFILGPLGWVVVDQAIDVIMMFLMSWLIGFHWLLLPTFAVKLIPVVDELPTWTACVLAVVAWRRREQKIS